MSLFKPLCKFCTSIRTVREIVPTVKKALAIAQSGTPGPVFIEFPIDTLYPFHLVSKEFVVKNPPKGLMGKIVSWYVVFALHATVWVIYNVCIFYNIIFWEFLSSLFFPNPKCVHMFWIIWFLWTAFFKGTFITTSWISLLEPGSPGICLHFPFTSLKPQTIR